MVSRYTSLGKGTKMGSRSWRSLCLDTWFPEIVALIFSIACFLAICGILFAYHQEIRPELYYGLSLNAIISVLATACKSSLIFVIGEAMGQLKWTWFFAKPKKLLDIQTLDSASRGPLGSITTLFQETRRSLASLGAAVIILLLAFDPFIQQIISYPTRLAAIHDATHVATAKKLNYFAPGIEYDVTYPSGFWSEDTIPHLNCPSGNCTWNNFRSIGMCSRCVDITESMDLKCKNIGGSPRSTEILRNVYVGCQLAPPQGNSTQFDLNFEFVSIPPSKPWWAFPTAGLSWHVFSAYEHVVSQTPISRTRKHPFTWPGDPLMVVAYAEIGFNEEYLNLDVSDIRADDLMREIRVDKATQCSLELCVLEYEVSVESGTPDITTSVLDYGQLHWKNHPGYPTNTMNKTLCWAPTSGPPNITIEDPTIDDRALQLGPGDFTFCLIDNIGLNEDVFVGSIVQVHSYRDSSQVRTKPVGDGNTLRIGSVGLGTIMSNVAKHINKEALRFNGSDVHGTAYAIKVFVEVQWLWLILPVILMTSGTIFITIVIVENRKSGTSLWKSSVLAFLYHGLHDADKDDCMAASVMEKKAEQLVVQLQMCEDHGSLILQEKDSSV